MKKILILFASLSLSLCGVAKTLKIYSVNGNVSKKTGTTWTQLAKSSGTLSDNEVIKINPTSSIRLLDPTTRQVYTLGQEGTFSVSTLLKQAAADNSSLGGKIAAESRRQSDMAASKSHKAVGAAKRATLDEEEQEALYSALVSGFEKGDNVGTVELSKTPAEDGLFYLSILNSGSEPVYVNVFTRGDDGKWIALYTFDNENPALILSPGTTVAMDHLLLADDGDAPFVVVGYTASFDGAELTDMFAEDFEPEATAAENVSLYFVK